MPLFFSALPTNTGVNARRRQARRTAAIISPPVGVFSSAQIECSIKIPIHKSKAKITVIKIKLMRQKVNTLRSTIREMRAYHNILKENPHWTKIFKYKTGWIQYVNKMLRKRLPKPIQNYRLHGPKKLKDL
jgi:hypothetical protein